MSRPSRILIVEDDDVQRELLRSILELEDFVVIEASEGYEALSLMRKDLPSLLITDNFMPGLDGYSLIEEIRQDPTLSSIPIVLLSAGDENIAVNRKVLREGFDVFMQKPILADELMVALREALSRSGDS